MLDLTRAALIVLLVAGLSAVLLAVVSRAPAEVRLASPPDDAVDAARGAHFSDDQIARHGQYRRPAYIAVLLTIIVELAVLVVLALGPARRLVAATSSLPGGWLTQAVIVAGAVALVLWLAQLPLSYVRGFAMEHAWKLSTQDLAGWWSDRVKSLGIAAVTSAIAAVAFFGVVRWQPRWWWLLGWLVFTALTAALVFLYPVVIAPLFNRFTPLADESLRAGIHRLAEEADIDVEQILVADASRRTTAENAYVAGLGATKQVVLYDTLLRSQSEDQVLFVVAHELGHKLENHVIKNVVIASVGLLAGFALLAWLSLQPWAWSWAGASGVADVRALPVLLLFAAVAGMATAPLQATISRAFESKADEIAIELIEDPQPAVRAFRRLAFSNLADLAPPKPAVVTLFSHPPIPARIRAILEEARGHP